MRTNEELFRLSAERNQAQDWRGYCDLFHPTESVYVDPLFGELRGRDKIRDWFRARELTLIRRLILAHHATILEAWHEHCG